MYCLCRVDEDLALEEDMAEVSGIKMTPVDGGDSVPIPSGKTTIGRGTFLQVMSVCIVA